MSDMMNLPTELNLKNVTKLSSAITGSELNSIISSNGYSYDIGLGANGSYVNFVLPSNEKLNIDLNSVYITGEISFPSITTNSNTVGTTFFLTSDNIESMIDMIQVSINGNIVEEIRNYNLIETAIYPWNISQGYTDAIQSSSYQGSNWRLKHLLLTDNSKIDGIAAATSITPNAQKFAFPIRLSGVFSGTDKLFPTYLADGNMQLRIYLKGAESVIKAIKLDGSGVLLTANPTSVSKYTLSNMKLHYKAVTVSENYYSSLISYVGSDKYTIPIDTFYSELKNVFVKAGSSSWSESINCNLSNVNSIFLAFFKTSELNQNAMGEDRPQYPFLSTCRVQINGKSVPVGPAIDFTSEEGKYNLLRALNSMRSAETIGNFSMPQLLIPTDAAGSFVSLGGTNYVSLGYYYNRVLRADTFPNYNASNYILPANNIERNSCFLAGFDCRKSDYETDQLSGLDLSSNGQITIQATFNNSAALGGGVDENYTCCIFVHHTKVLSIGGGNVEIMD